MINKANRDDKVEKEIRKVLDKKGQYVMNFGCGTGKSTAMKEILLDKSLNKKILYITDRKDNLKEVIDGNREVYHLKSAEEDNIHFYKKIMQSKKHNHVAMTTQMFELLNLESKKELYKDRILVVDEKVKFHKWIKINDTYMGLLSSKLDYEFKEDTKDVKELRKIIAEINTDFVSYTNDLISKHKTMTVKKIRTKLLIS